jgi:hypothetical protein
MNESTKTVQEYLFRSFFKRVVRDNTLAHKAEVDPLLQKIESAIEKYDAVKRGDARWKDSPISQFYEANNYPDLAKEFSKNRFYCELTPIGRKFSIGEAQDFGQAFLEAMCESAESDAERDKMLSRLKYWKQNAQYVIKPVFCLGEIL